jgi:hypothetical protein
MLRAIHTSSTKLLDQKLLVALQNDLVSDLETSINQTKGGHRREIIIAGSAPLGKIRFGETYKRDIGSSSVAPVLYPRVLTDDIATAADCEVIVAATRCPTAQQSLVTHM